MLLMTTIMPGLTALILGFFGHLIGKKWAQRISSIIGSTNLGVLLGAFLVSALTTKNTYCHIYVTEWLKTPTLQIDWMFNYDPLSTTMLVVVSSVSLLVLLYSTDYLATDPYLIRFLAFIHLFTFFMFILVTSSNCLQLLVGWEGVGLCSFLLINFWSTRLQATKAALKAMLINKIGDLGLIWFTCLNIYYLKTTDFSLITTCAPMCEKFFGYDYVTILSFSILLSVIGKSAQFLLHVWLADAMEGPTPVSALIHAATMVTAGVFVLLRLSNTIVGSDTCLTAITLVGLFTAIFAGLVATAQTDIKKIIAYSTCSQLGIMVMSCGLENFDSSFFHLITHAFFKALLFLSAGAIIHVFNNQQDLRQYGGIFYLAPLAATTTVVGSAALIGFPYTAGFYSKDIIIETTLMCYRMAAPTLSYLVLAATALTAAYSTKITLKLCGRYNGYKPNLHTHPATPVTIYVLGILGLLSIYSGFFYNKYIKNNFLVFPQNTAETLLTTTSMTIGIFVSIATGFALTALTTNIKPLPINSYLKLVFVTLNQKFFIDKLLNTTATVIFKKFKNTIFFIDKGLLELIGPTGVKTAFFNSSQIIKSTDSGVLSNYTTILVVTVFALSVVNGIVW